MKRAIRHVGHLLCTLALLFCFALPAAASDETSYFDCTLFLYGIDAAAENITASSCAIQVQAGDGSGDTWAVASYGVTSGATYYLATDPYDSSVNTVAELIMGDAASGIAVFRLESRIDSRTAPVLRTLDGLNTGDGVVVAGMAEDSDGLYLFSRGAVLQGLNGQSGGYSLIQLEDGTYPLSEVNIQPIAALMMDVGQVVGFYTDSYLALPAGYIMPNAGGIGSLGSGTTEPEPGPGSEDPSSGAEEPSGGSYTLESIQTNTGTQELLEQARTQQGQTQTVQIVLIAAAVLAAAGIVVFAILRSRKNPAGGSQPSRHDQTDEEQGQAVGKTEYVGGEDYGKTQPAQSQYRVVPLPGTPGEARDIPIQGLTFGRSPECDVVFSPDTAGVSGKHCSLRWRNGALFLTDLGSSFGTLLGDGRKLSNESADLKPGDSFCLGSHKIGFRVEEL